MSVRMARPEDGPEVVRLASVMYESMGLDVSGGAWRENDRRMVEERSGGDDCAVFVVEDAERSGRLVSCGGVTILTRLPGPGVPTARFGYVQWMVTDPEHR